MITRLCKHRGSFSIVGKTGTMAAGLAAASPIFSFRWNPSSPANAKAFIDRVNVSVASLGTGFAAGVGYIDAAMARAFTVTDHGGVTAPVMTSAVASESGGTIAAGTYYYVVTAIGPWGESAASSESSGAVITGSTGSVTVTYGAVSGATGYRIYRGTVSGTYDVYYDDLASTYVDTGANGVASALYAPETGGGFTLSGNNAKRLTGSESTLVTSVRMSSTATLVAGTRTLDSQAFGAVQFAVGTAQNTVYLASRDGDLWRAADADSPQILTAGEGFVLRATVPATGTWQGVVAVDWREVIA